MSNVNTEGLPVEMQQRIAQIIQQAKAQAPAPAAPTQPSPVAAPQQRPVAPPVKQLTLMDHTVALRQEVAALRQELNAVAQVTDAVGQAVGQLYTTFLGQTEFTNQGVPDQTQYQEYVDDNNDY